MMYTFRSYASQLGLTPAQTYLAWMSICSASGEDPMPASYATAVDCFHLTRLQQLQLDAVAMLELMLRRFAARVPFSAPTRSEAEAELAKLTDRTSLDLDVVLGYGLDLDTLRPMARRALMEKTALRYFDERMSTMLGVGGMDFDCLDLPGHWLAVTLARKIGSDRAMPANVKTDAMAAADRLAAALPASSVPVATPGAELAYATLVRLLHVHACANGLPPDDARRAWADVRTLASALLPYAA